MLCYFFVVEIYFICKCKTHHYHLLCVVWPITRFFLRESRFPRIIDIAYCDGCLNRVYSPMSSNIFNNVKTGRQDLDMFGIAFSVTDWNSGLTGNWTILSFIKEWMMSRKGPFKNIDMHPERGMGVSGLYHFLYKTYEKGEGERPFKFAYWY